MLRGITKSGQDKHLSMQRELLWLYIPNWENNGSMESINSIPNRSKMKHKENFKGLDCKNTKVTIKKGLKLK